MSENALRRADEVGTSSRLGSQIDVDGGGGIFEQRDAVAEDVLVKAFGGADADFDFTVGGAEVEAGLSRRGNGERQQRHQDHREMKASWHEDHFVSSQTRTTCEWECTLISSAHQPREQESSGDADLSSSESQAGSGCKRLRSGTVGW